MVASTPAISWLIVVAHNTVPCYFFLCITLHLTGDMRSGCTQLGEASLVGNKSTFCTRSNSNSACWLLVRPSLSLSNTSGTACHVSLDGFMSSVYHFSPAAALSVMCSYLGAVSTVAPSQPNMSSPNMQCPTMSTSHSFYSIVTTLTEITNCFLPCILK